MRVYTRGQAARPERASVATGNATPIGASGSRQGMVGRAGRRDARKAGQHGHMQHDQVQDDEQRARRHAAAPHALVHGRRQQPRRRQPARALQPASHTLYCACFPAGKITGCSAGNSLP